MLKTLTSMLSKRRTVHAELELDHLELCHEHLVIGLQIAWCNNTPEPIEISEVLLRLPHEGSQRGPTQLTYNGRFVRIPYQSSITKIAGLNSFHVPAGETRNESLRFLTRDILDLEDGSYSAELHTTVADGTYVHDFDLRVIPDVKFRNSAPDRDTGGPGATASSTYTRALRLGLH